MSNPKTQLVGGIHSVRTALFHGGDSVERIWVEARRRDPRMREVLDLAREHGVAVDSVSREELDRMAPGINHQGVVARTRATAPLDEHGLDDLLEGLDHPPFLLVLDGVQDPHNLGACLRSADAAGVDAVIVPKDRAAGLTPTACKVASGAAESLPFVQVTNLARTLERIQQHHRVWCVGAAGEGGTSLFAADLRGPLALVMGGEQDGLRRLTRERCDLLVHIPMAGQVESLNVSVAAGICLFEAVRQRG